MKTHEELISIAFEAYLNSTLNYGLSDTEMVKKLQNMSDAFLYGFIAYCENTLFN
ncbi:MAG: hypothetical protein IKT42_06450 [Clostridia bacterium]|nr:hypothetical protein [Clostridia bacterium]